MNITILTQIYLPEMGALSNRLYPIIRRLSEAGHRVTVATGMPNYPAGRVFDGYRRRLFVREKTEHCEIVRTAYITVPRNRSKLTQMLSYLSFMPAVFLSALFGGKTDVVLITSPPIFPLVPAILLARLRGARLIFDIRDLWSDELATYSEISQDSLLIRIIRAVEKWGYQAADLVVCTTKSLVETVIERGGKPDTTFYLPNGADLELFKPLPPLNPVADSFGFGDRFVVMYSGLFGIKHGLEVLLDAADRLRERDDIVFFLIGNGARRDALEKIVRKRGLRNVTISGERPIEDIPHLLARADVCFAACRPEPYPKKLISVKVFEYLACERPVIGAFEGESARIVNESGGGIVVPPGRSDLVADAVLQLRNSPKLRSDMGRVGRGYIERHFSRTEWAYHFESLIASKLRPDSQPGSMPAATKVDLNA